MKRLTLRDVLPRHFKHKSEVRSSKEWRLVATFYKGVITMKDSS